MAQPKIWKKSKDQLYHFISESATVFVPELSGMVNFNRQYFSLCVNLGTFNKDRSSQR